VNFIVRSIEGMNPIRRNRVLLIVENHSYPEDTRVLHEAQTLVVSGYQVSVICPARSKRPWREKIDGVRVFRYPSPAAPKRLWGYLWEYGYSLAMIFLNSLCVSLNPGFDIIHVANPPDSMVFMAAFYKLFGKRFIYDHHDLVPELYNARFGRSGHRLIYRTLVWLEKLSCVLADQIITTNQSYKALEIERGHVQAERITIVRNGPDDQFISIDSEPGARQLGQTIIAYAGTIGIQDGVEYLLRALQHMVGDMGRTDFLCLLVGDGDALPMIKSMTVELGLTKFVSFTGWVDSASVARHLSGADICVSPEPSNPYNDRSTMIKIMEYMAKGKPIVAFDLLEHRVSAEGAALFARPNDIRDFARKIVALMDDSEQRNRLGQLGRERIEKELSWAHQEKFLLHAYDKINANCSPNECPK